MDLGLRFGTGLELDKNLKFPPKTPYIHLEKKHGLRRPKILIYIYKAACVSVYDSGHLVPGTNYKIEGI